MVCFSLSLWFSGVVQNTPYLAEDGDRDRPPVPAADALVPPGFVLEVPAPPLGLPSPA